MKLNNKGQALVEYVLIIALISVACIGVINIFGEKIKNKIAQQKSIYNNGTSCYSLWNAYFGYIFSKREIFQINFFPEQKTENQHYYADKRQ